jgi:hypothetical protein
VKKRSEEDSRANRKLRRRLARQALKEERRKRKQANKELREQQKAQGLVPAPTPSLPNRKNGYETEEEERKAREDATTEQSRVIRSQLPVLLGRLSKIRDFRNPKKLKHKLTVVLMYGILTFVYQMESRREANRKMTRPMFMENLRTLFPELEDLPHQDTLNRLLSGIEVDQIEEAHVDLVRRLIRKKKFCRYLIQNCYAIAMDGTQKLVRSEVLSEEWLERQVKSGDEKKTQYYVYVLEANLVFHNGMVIPLLSEFLDYSAGDPTDDKQDCELKAFRRLSERLNKEFPRLDIMMLLDGLYANGPVIENCRKKKWQFMIVLKDDSLPSVWEEFEGLGKLLPKNCLERNWGNRRQRFRWVNDIEYCYGAKGRKRQIVHVVVCEESWEEIDKETGQLVTKTSRHAWLSSERLNKRNVHERCNLGARHRWGIEAGILVEKRQGYQYEHCFSHNWNAMRGYHYLMRLGHMFNVLAVYSTALLKTVLELGVRGFIDFVRETLSGPWLDPERVRERLAAPFQLRLE